ncbi:unnamed protein product, partial [Ectocarpus fasciculatus]
MASSHDGMTSANNRIAMFGANFTKAAAGNNTLELVN